MKRRTTLWLSALLAIAPAAAPASDCTHTSVGFTPIGDLGAGLYLATFQGGHYPGGSNAVPPAHHSVGVAHALAIQPRTPAGVPNPAGKYVMLSIGMSNATQEFCSASSLPPCDAWTFMGQAAVHPHVNHTTLVIINGARGGQTTSTWDDPTDPNYDMVRDQKLIPAGVSEAQVQAGWVKCADANPTLSLPNVNANAYALQSGLGRVARAMKVRYPNLQVVFFSNRIYAGYASTTLNPEPYAYESGFAVKWIVQAQIDQMANGGVIVDPLGGDLNYSTVAPWVGWGPDLWADGVNPRSDGLTYVCSDLEGDGTHPNTTAETKVATLLLRQMLLSPYSYPWFSICHPGDPNGDGKIDGRDVEDFVATLLNPPAATPQKRCACDLNASATVTVDDVPLFVAALLSPLSP